ncbi:MAG: hydrogenase nickel incorporation protein HypB [Deltaproteobacteria bacterium]|nr:hydrogenase nickel incorporation protein HypB [Deltaproteobacteria bacterium]MBW2068766.1 hydrogenase nickel incorporation protein HypB [Deltaproteobacteria bacterium]
MEKVQIPVIRNILEAHERLAQENRRIFDKAKVFVINLMSSPGAGKTSLLEQTIRALSDQISVGVIEGDIQSSEDAERIQKTNVPVVQINTGGACHLDPSMIRSALDALDLSSIDLLIIENVGNLVCPAEFNLGEHRKIMILSVTEGDDKALKYPLMFRMSSVLLINKIDLLPYIDFDVEKIRKECKKLNPHQIIFEISCKTGRGISQWVKWLESELDQHYGEVNWW